MIFIHPKWQSAGERIGKHMCTPCGYWLHEISNLIGRVGLDLLIIGAVAYFGLEHEVMREYPRIALVAVPVAIGILGMALHRISWMLADRKQWSYDATTQTAWWMDNGQWRTYTAKEPPANVPAESPSGVEDEEADSPPADGYVYFDECVPHEARALLDAFVADNIRFDLDIANRMIPDNYHGRGGADARVAIAVHVEDLERALQIRADIFKIQV